MSLVALIGKTDSLLTPIRCPYCKSQLGRFIGDMAASYYLEMKPGLHYDPANERWQLTARVAKEWSYAQKQLGLKWASFNPQPRHYIPGTLYPYSLPWESARIPLEVKCPACGWINGILGTNR